MSYVMGAIAPDRQGVAGGLSQMMRMVGVVAGVAGASMFFDARLRRHVGDATAPTEAATFVAAYRDTFLLAAAVCAAAAVASVVRPPPRRAPAVDKL
jgi:hypothetical protein